MRSCESTAGNIARHRRQECLEKENGDVDAAVCHRDIVVAYERLQSYLKARDGGRMPVPEPGKCNGQTWPQ